MKQSSNTLVSELAFALLGVVIVLALAAASTQEPTGASSDFVLIELNGAIPKNFQPPTIRGRSDARWLVQPTPGKDSGILFSLEQGVPTEDIQPFPSNAKRIRN
ncbi:hypothetical protein SH501x_003203 [Pirellulaceae bacterium SH501]